MASSMEMPIGVAGSYGSFVMVEGFLTYLSEIRGEVDLDLDRDDLDLDFDDLASWGRPDLSWDDWSRDERSWEDLLLLLERLCWRSSSL